MKCAKFKITYFFIFHYIRVAVISVCFFFFLIGNNSLDFFSSGCINELEQLVETHILF